MGFGIQLKALLVFSPAALCGYSCAYGAAMASGTYRITMLNQSVAGSGAAVAGGGYSILGSAGQTGQQNLSGAVYSVSPGIISSLKPAAVNLDHAYAFPNPFKASRGHQFITFSKLTYSASIKIYTVSGELVKTIDKNSSLDNITWDLSTASGQTVASGLYLYVIDSSSSRKTGKLIIVR